MTKPIVEALEAQKRTEPVHRPTGTCRSTTPRLVLRCSGVSPALLAYFCVTSSCRKSSRQVGRIDVLTQNSGAPDSFPKLYKCSPHSGRIPAISWHSANSVTVRICPALNLVSVKQHSFCREEQAALKQYSPSYHL